MKEENEKKVSGFMCVKCGKNATKGSMKHPYCKKCFKEEFNNNNKDYELFMSRSHY